MQIAPFHTDATPNVHHVWDDCPDLPKGCVRRRGTHGWPICVNCLRRLRDAAPQVHR